MRAMKNNKFLNLRWLALCAALLLTACGGGNNPPPPAGNSNWDQMVWDQDNWA